MCISLSLQRKPTSAVGLRGEGKQKCGADKCYQDWHGKSNIQHDADSLRQQTWLKFKDETDEVLHFGHSWKLGTSENISGITPKSFEMWMDKISWTELAKNEQAVHRVKEDKNALHV